MITDIRGTEIRPGDLVAIIDGNGNVGQDVGFIWNTTTRKPFYRLNAVEMVNVMFISPGGCGSTDISLDRVIVLMHQDEMKQQALAHLHLTNQQR